MESFPAQSPYNYAYNSPMQWKDPSGLAPEKEEKKGKAKVQYAAIAMKEFVDMSFIIGEQLAEQQRFARMKQIAKDIFDCMVAAMRTCEMPARLAQDAGYMIIGYIGVGGGCGSSSGGSGGGDGSSVALTDERKDVI